MADVTDMVRQLQGRALDLCGFGPAEAAYRVIASGRLWSLREYAGAGSGPPLLIVAAPVKQPYIWDIAPAASVVSFCLRRGLRVYLLEWRTPAYEDKDAGLVDYAVRSIGAAVDAVSSAEDGAKPFLIGHSLGGTFAAIFAAHDPAQLRGLVVLSAPLSFAPGSSTFRDALASMASAPWATIDIVPGSLVSQLSAVAAPETFLWSRLVDAGLSLGDSRASEIHLRIERWTLDELPLPGRLVREVLQWLYREDRFSAGTLRIDDKTLDAQSLNCPTLAVVNTADAIVPPASIAPFLARMRPGYAHLIEYPGDIGVGLQHLAVLVGRRAHGVVWPKIAAWLLAAA
jgi:polyhydroxyalkanoate synthase subunit PhaC